MFGRNKTGGAVDYIIVGLGNPDKKYEITRHNAGFITADIIADKYDCKINKVKFKSLVGECRINGKRVLIMKPSTYMNNSGQAVVEAMNFYKLPAENVIVIFDDISLDVGKLRIRKKGSDGGQKGMRSIIYLSGKDTFPRIKIGIGAKPNPEWELADWVLSKFTPKELEEIKAAAENALGAVELMVNGETDKAMNRYN
ncbi:MAG: aminoacyl-tRNA hydrolase [Acutalibacteraceae bacterium]